MKIKKICVIGLGYVGLPLLLALNKHFKVVGSDIDENKILRLKKYKNIKFENNFSNIKDCNVYI